MKLLAMRGISGSGKTTYVEDLKRQNWAVVSRDNIRETLFKDYQSVDEDAVTAIQDNMINVLLKAGRNVVVDDTNVRAKYVKRFAKLAWELGADFDVKQIDCDVTEAISRVLERSRAGGRYVPAEVIKKQAQALKSSKDVDLSDVYVQAFKPYVKPGGPRCILVDIDGTLAHNNGHRGFYEWDKVGGDDVVQAIDDLVRTLWSAGLKVVVMSGRDEVCRPETIKWLQDYDIKWNNLYMRPEGDQRKDSIVKMELFDKYIRDQYDVELVLDDRNQVVDAWRSIGLTCLQVAPGDF